jgi:hypothetical protein
MMAGSGPRRLTAMSWHVPASWRHLCRLTEPPARASAWCWLELGIACGVWVRANLTRHRPRQLRSQFPVHPPRDPGRDRVRRRCGYCRETRCWRWSRRPSQSRRLHRGSSTRSRQHSPHAAEMFAAVSLTCDVVFRSGAWATLPRSRKACRLPSSCLAPGAHSTAGGRRAAT